MPVHYRLASFLCTSDIEARAPRLCALETWALHLAPGGSEGAYGAYAAPGELLFEAAPDGPNRDL